MAKIEGVGIQRRKREGESKGTLLSWLREDAKKKRKSFTEPSFTRRGGRTRKKYPKKKEGRGTLGENLSIQSLGKAFFWTSYPLIKPLKKPAKEREKGI